MVQSVTQRTMDAELSHAQLTSLEPEDRFTRMEFERRYSAMPQCPKAELIEGAVHMRHWHASIVMHNPRPTSSGG